MTRHLRAIGGSAVDHEAQLQLEGERAAQDDAEQRAQIDRAKLRLAIREERLTRFQWRAVDRTVGPVVPGEVAILAAPSGGGKSEVAENIAAWHVRAGRRVYLASLEVRPEETRLKMAARACGRHPGNVLSFSDRPLYVREGEPRWDADVTRALEEQNRDLLRLSPHETLDAAAVEEIGATASAVRADLLIIDHIDHVSDSGGQTATGASIDVTRALHRVAKRYRLPVIATSQLNVHGRGGDRFASYKPVRLESIKYGGVKMEIASIVLGIYRPLAKNATSEQKKAVESGQADDGTVLEPNMIALNVLKCRARGDAIGKRIALRWDHGTIRDLEPGL